jgi:hypothetical protein
MGFPSNMLRVATSLSSAALPFTFSTTPDTTEHRPQAISAVHTAPAQIWGACGISTPEDKIVATYSKGVLRCGNGEVGYRHIQKQHQSQWQGLADIEGRNWRDIADMAIAKSMDSPDVQRSTAGGKYCYSGQIYLVDKVRGTVAKTVHPTVIVPLSSRTIITAYPGGACP